MAKRTSTSRFSRTSGCRVANTAIVPSGSILSPVMIIGPIPPFSAKKPNW
jgi:hypothetical protein